MLLVKVLKREDEKGFSLYKFANHLRLVSRGMKGGRNERTLLDLIIIQVGSLRPATTLLSFLFIRIDGLAADGISEIDDYYYLSMPFIGLRFQISSVNAEATQW